MDPVYEFTRDQLIEAFKSWSEQSALYPGSSIDFENTQEMAEIRADYPIELLEKA